MIAFVLGTRPEITKLSPLIARIPQEQRQVIWTGQHWSESLLGDELWAAVSRNHLLSVPIGIDMGCTRNELDRLSLLVEWLNGSLPQKHLRWLVVLGDTTSALAGALAGAKLGIPVYHVEAGSRSGDRSQPEELNRKLIDQCATGHAHSYHCDGTNLEREGIRSSFWSGEIAIEPLIGVKAEPGSEIIVTIHRAETLNDPQALGGITQFLRELAEDHHVAFYCHPHTAQVLPVMMGNVVVRNPLPPSEFRDALRKASSVVTDSGGVAIEAAYLGVPCVIAREVTELADLVECGRIIVGGRTAQSLWQALAVAQRDAPLSEKVQHAWQGQASEHIAERLMA